MQMKMHNQFSVIFYEDCKKIKYLSRKPDPKQTYTVRASKTNDPS